MRIMLILIGILFASLGATFPGNAARGAFRERPAIVENGTDVVLFPPFPLDVNQPAGGLLTFVPDGTAYYTSNQTTGTVAHLLADGTSMPVPALTVPGADLELYANHLFYFGGRSGLIRMQADGTHRRFWQIKGAAVLGVGPKGNIYFTEMSGTIDYIASNGTVTRLAEPYGPTTNSVVGPDGNLYFGSTNYVEPNTYGGVAVLRGDGTESYFPLADKTARVEVGSMASARGALYFLTGSTLWRLLTTGSMVAVARIPQLYDGSSASTNVGSLVVDRGGDLWLIDAGYSGTCPSNDGFFGFLFFFNVGTGHFSGPFEPNVLNDLQQLTIGPDNNVWLQNVNEVPGPAYGFTVQLGAYVRNVQTLEPASLVISVTAPGSFGILETKASGPWTAVSSSPAIVTVSPATSITGTFGVVETGKGTTSIAVSDRFGNVSYETVKAQ